MPRQTTLELHSVKYPYRPSYLKSLVREGLTKRTIIEYDNTLIDLFKFLSNFNEAFQKNPQINNVLTQDVQQYLVMLVEKREISDTTYQIAKMHISRYFVYLFNRNLTDNLPTLTLPKHTNQPHTLSLHKQWLDDMPQLLIDNRLNIYSRLVCLLISHAYRPKELLKPGLYNRLNPEQEFKLKEEKQFWNTYVAFIKPLWQLHGIQELFLRQTPGDNPILYNSSLHSYLQSSERVLGYTLDPTKLYQSFIIKYLQDHPEASDVELMTILRLNSASLTYYHHLLRNLNR